MAQEQGIDLIFNTPNSKSKPGYLKMGWAEVGQIDVLIRPSLRSILQSQRAPRNTRFLATGVPKVDRIRDRQPIGLRTPRSREYLQWRYSSHPTARFNSLRIGDTHLFARSNVRELRRELVISDVIGQQVSDAIRKAARSHTAQYMVAHFSKGSPERRAAYRSGMVALPGVTALTLVAKPLRDLPLDVLDLRSWDISMGDLELL
jgi:hypothetical protein